MPLFFHRIFPTVLRKSCLLFKVVNTSVNISKELWRFIGTIPQNLTYFSCTTFERSSLHGRVSGSPLHLGRSDLMLYSRSRRRGTTVIMAGIHLHLPPPLITELDRGPLTGKIRRIQVPTIG